MKKTAIFGLPFNVHGHVDAVRVLLAAGAEVNDQDLEGQTALHRAAGNRHVPVMNVLLERERRLMSNAMRDTLHFVWLP